MQGLSACRRRFVGRRERRGHFPLSFSLHYLRNQHVSRGSEPFPFLPELASPSPPIIRLPSSMKNRKSDASAAHGEGTSPVECQPAASELMRPSPPAAQALFVIFLPCRCRAEELAEREPGE